METWAQLFVTLLVGAFGGGGFWAYLQKRDTTKDATTRLLMGLAYDKITDKGLEHIGRGYITKDEYEDFRKYLYEPYKALGGNGVAERIMTAVSQLPLRPNSRYEEIAQAAQAGRENQN